MSKKYTWFAYMCVRERETLSVFERETLSVFERERQRDRFVFFVCAR